MPSKNQFIKRYQNFYGFDLKSSDLNYPEQYARDINNLDINPVGSLVKRKGIAPYAGDAGPLGIFTYNRINTAGVEVPELLTVTDTLKKFFKTQITVTYTGAATSAALSLYYDPATSVYRCQIMEGTTLVLDQSLGLGVNDAVPYTCNQLKTVIDALANFTATITGTTTTPAAYCSNVFEGDLKAGTVTLSAGYWAAVNSPLATPFSAAYATRNSVDFEPCSAVQLQNVMYFATGADEVQKYDGQNLYRAGLPTPVDGDIVTALGGSGLIVGTNYRHLMQYVQIDANGNIVEGNWTQVTPLIQPTVTIGGYVAGAQTTVTTIQVDDGSGGVPNIAIGDFVNFYDSVSAARITREVTNRNIAAPPYTITIAGAAVTVADNADLKKGIKINVTVDNILAASGFNTNCAIVAGAQGSPTPVTTITVDNGSGGAHTMKVGDTAYFYDAVTAGYITREVTGVTLGTITIAGAGVTVADNAVISNNLRIRLLRNETSATEPTLFYELVDLPNNSFTATQVYVDSTPDESLGIEWIPPLTDRSAPPKARYLTAFQNLLIAGSLTTDPNVVAWSDIESCEYFPTPDNQQIVQNLEGDRITAVAPSNEVLVVFQRGAIHAMSGDLSEQNYRIEQVTNDVGCIAHQSVRDIRGVIFFLSAIGPRMMSGGSLPQALGPFGDNKLVSRIDPLFLQLPSVPAEELWRTTRAWALHDRQNQKYLLFIPKETVDSGVRYCNEDSVILAYDYSRDAWLKWQGINAGAGIAYFQGDVLFAERAINLSSVARTVMYRRQSTGYAIDYQDHNEAISTLYKGPWDFMGEASVLKNYLICRVFTTDLVSNEFTLDCSTELNFVPNAPVSLFTLSVGSGGYGIAAYSTEPYGNPQNSSVKHKISNGRAKSLAMVFENSEEQKDLVITGYELEVVTPYKPAMKV